MDYLADKKLIDSIITECLDKLKAVEYKGYDPADFMISNLKIISKLPPSIVRILTIINFLSPVNFRRVLKIHPSENTTAMIVIAKTYLRSYRKYQDKKYLDEAIKIERWIYGNSISNNKSRGWSRRIPYQTRSSYLHKSGSTLTYINANALDMYLELYDASKETYYLDVSKEIFYHLRDYTNKINYDYGCCLSYVNDAYEEIPNASILAGAALNKYYGITNENTALELSLKILDYTLHKQNINGSWDYSFQDGKVKKRQYDFHQVYMLDGIKTYKNGLNPNQKKKIKDAFDLGVEFYFDKQFDKKMRPLWRYPVKYPTDIHNISHAIYLLAKYKEIIPEATLKLNKLLQMLITEFYNNEKKYFYYQKYPFITVKHNFIRWNTSWSLSALSNI